MDKFPLDGYDETDSFEDIIVGVAEDMEGKEKPTTIISSKLCRYNPDDTIYDVHHIALVVSKEELGIVDFNKRKLPHKKESFVEMIKRRF